MTASAPMNEDTVPNCHPSNLLQHAGFSVGIAAMYSCSNGFEKPFERQTFVAGNCASLAVPVAGAMR